VGQMLPEQVIAMLNSSGPAQGVDALLAMPPDRVEVVLASMTPGEIARLLEGARVHRRAELLMALGPVRGPIVLAQIPRHRVADLVSSLPLSSAAGVLRTLPSAEVAELLLEIPTQARLLLQEALGAQQPIEHAAAAYHRLAQESVGRIAARMSTLDHGSPDVLAEIMGRTFHVVIRYSGGSAFTGDDLRYVAGQVDWRRAAVVVVITNVAPGDSVLPVLRELRQFGHVADVIRWVDDRDDGTFKRSLVRLLV
jgi:hypothetical protein